jgi:predicted DNA repair protein MutK
MIVIALGTVAGAPFGQQVAVLAGVAALMTEGVYGIVAGIVKMDDAGLYLSRRGGAGALVQGFGRGLLAAAPMLMKLLSVAGTLAMFMVGGGILVHGMPALHHVVEAAAEGAGRVPVAGALLRAVTPTAIDAVAGIAAGALVLAAVTATKSLLRRVRRA